MSMMAFQITSVSIVCSTVCSVVDQRKHQNATSLAFVRGIHRWPVNSPHKGPETRRLFLFDDVIMYVLWLQHLTFALRYSMLSSFQCNTILNSVTSEAIANNFRNGLHHSHTVSCLQIKQSTYYRIISAPIKFLFNAYIYQIFKIKNVYIYLHYVCVVWSFMFASVFVGGLGVIYVCGWNLIVPFFQNININANSPLNQIKPLFTAYLWNHVVSYIATKRHNGIDTPSS